MLFKEKTAVIVKGGGDIGTGVAHRLFREGYRIVVVDIDRPTAVRRQVSFCEAIYQGEVQVEEVRARKIAVDKKLVEQLKLHQFVPVVVDQDNSGSMVIKLFELLRHQFKPHILIDAILAKKNLGTSITDADLVLGLGPGFVAGNEVHYIIETNRGPDLGKVIRSGSAEPDTKVPAPVLGISGDRVIRAPMSGIFNPAVQIGQMVMQGQNLGEINGNKISAPISGLIRGLLKEGLSVKPGMKLGDIDPRGDAVKANRISDKADKIAEGVSQAIGQFFGVTS